MNPQSDSCRCKRILIVSDVFLVGGVETQIAGMIRVMRNSGCHVHLAIGSGEIPSNLQDQLSGTLTGLALSSSATAADLIKITDLIAGYIEANRIDLVHVHPFISCIPSFLAASKNAIPAVVTLHGPASIQVDWLGPAYQILLKAWVLQAASYVFAVSEEVYEIASHYVQIQNIKICPNGVDISRFKPSGAEPARNRWVAISRLDDAKTSGILDLCSRLQYLDIAELDIIGDGPDFNRLSAFINDRGLSSHIRLLGQSHDTAALISSYKGVAAMGRAALEGAAAGKPVLLVGYDGIKGLLALDLCNKVAVNNFSGRGLANASDEAMKIQFQELRYNPGRFELRKWITENRSEDQIWNSYLQLVSGIQRRHASNRKADAVMAALLKAVETGAPVFGNCKFASDITDVFLSEWHLARKNSLEQWFEVQAEIKARDEMISNQAVRIGEVERALAENERLAKEQNAAHQKRYTVLKSAMEQQDRKIADVRSSRKYKTALVASALKQKPLLNSGKCFKWMVGGYQKRGISLIRALDVCDPLETPQFIETSPPGVQTYSIANQISIQDCSNDKSHVLVSMLVDDFCDGGLEQVVINLSRSLGKSGLRTEIIVTGKCGRSAQIAKSMGIAVAEFPDPSVLAEHLKRNRP
jgi:glycosyltransferase involved in cell wall biosynthesis